MSALTQIKTVFLLATQITKSDVEIYLKEAKHLFPQVKEWRVLVYNSSELTQEQLAETASSEIHLFTKKELGFFRKRIKKSLLKPYVALSVDVLIALNTEDIGVFSFLLNKTQAPFKMCASETAHQAFNVFLPNTTQTEAPVSLLMTAVKSFFENIDIYEY